MDEITFNLVVLAGLLLIGGIVFVIIRSKQVENEQAIVQMATANGWDYELIRKPLASGIQLSANSWVFEALSESHGQESDSGSSNVEMTTVWRAQAFGSTLLIGPRTSTVNLGSMGAELTRQVLHLALGPAANGLSEVQLGSEAFRQQFMFWAQNVAEIEVFLSPAIQDLLLAWKGEKPLIKRTSEGLSIELRNTHLKKADEIQALIRLGNSILKQL